MEKTCENCKHYEKKSMEYPCTVCCHIAPDKWERSQEQSNADRIRAMSDEELAGFLENIIDCDACPVVNSCEIISNGNCPKNILTWLQSEAE